MDPLEALIEILQQINDLSGAALDTLLQAGGGGAEAGAPAEPEAGAPVPVAPPTEG